MPGEELLAQATAMRQRCGGGSSRTHTLQLPRDAESLKACPEAWKMVQALLRRDTLPHLADAAEA